MDATGIHTFLIAAYKESPFLEQCICSLLNQSVKSRLLITTSTPSPFLFAIAEKYQIELKTSGAPPCIADDWQFAVDQCETPYYTIAHQDDVYYRGYTEALLPYMEESCIAFCDYEELTRSGKRSKTAFLNIKRLLLWPFYMKKSISSAFWKRGVLRFGCPLICPGVMYNKALCAGFAFTRHYSVSLDWDMWLKLAAANGAFTYCKDILMAHRIHEDSETSRQIAHKGRDREDLEIFSRLWPRPIALVLSKLYSKAYVSNESGKR